MRPATVAAAFLALIASEPGSCWAGARAENLDPAQVGVSNSCDYDELAAECLVRVQSTDREGVVRTRLRIVVAAPPRPALGRSAQSAARNLAARFQNLIDAARLGHRRLVLRQPPTTVAPYSPDSPGSLRWLGSDLPYFTGLMTENYLARLKAYSDALIAPTRGLGPESVEEERAALKWQLDRKAGEAPQVFRAALGSQVGGQPAD